MAPSTVLSNATHILAHIKVALIYTETTFAKQLAEKFALKVRLSNVFYSRLISFKVFFKNLPK